MATNIVNPNQPQTIQDDQEKRRTSVGTPTSSGAFTNVQRIMGANQGAGQKLGQFVGGNIQKQASNFGQNVGQQYGQFVNEAEKNRKKYDTSTQFAQNTIQNAGQNLYGNNLQQTGQPQGDQNQQPPQVNTGQSFAQLSKEQQDALTNSQANQELLSRFSDLRSGTYAGPTNLVNAAGEDITGQVINQAQQIGNLGQQTRTGQGRQALLQQQFTNPGYTQQKQALDSYLLGANKAALAPARQQAFAAQRTGTGSASSAQQLGKFFGQEAQAVGQKTKDLLTGAEGEQQKALETKASEAQKARDERFKQLQEQIASGSGDLELTKQEAADLGIGAGDELYSGYSQALSLDPTQAVAQNVADVNQFQNLKALRQLGGQDLGVYGDISQAGKFYDNQFDFNKDTAKQIREEAISKALQGAGGDIATMATAMRAAQNPYLSNEYVNALISNPMNMQTGNVDLNAVSNKEMQKANEAKQRALQSLAAQGFNVTGDLSSVYGNLGDRNDWYNRTYGSSGDFGSGVVSDQAIRNLLKSSRSVKIKD